MLEWYYISKNIKNYNTVEKINLINRVPFDINLT